VARTVTYFTDSVGFGGAEQALLTVLAGLNRQIWEPVLLYHPSSGIAPLIDGARQLAVELQPVPPLPEGLQGAKQVLPLARALCVRRPHVFHANLTWSISCKFGLVAAILARIPAIIATHHLYVDQPWSSSRYFQQRAIAAGVHRYVATSNEVARKLHYHFRLPTYKLRIVHAGVPVALYERPMKTGLRDTLTAGTNRAVILTTARLDAQKGHRYLIQAATHVPDAVFVLVGDGPERPALETQVRTLGLEDRVIFLGFRDDVPDLLACCDLHVLPSVFEGLGLSLIESMAAGKPVVASAIGGIDEVVIHGVSGLLVPPGDPIALARAISAILSNHSLAARLAAAGKERAWREFSAETMVSRITEVYEEILESAKATRVSF
jgi:glycosyltransferase involved in cell wall biosynthesis